MQGVFTRGSLLLAIFFLSIVSFAQDSSVYKWNYKSIKTGEGKYELIFSIDSATGWQLYAPNQDLGGVNTVEIKFPDSSIAVIDSFSEDGRSKIFISPIFQDTVKVYEGKTEWRIPISI